MRVAYYTTNRRLEVTTPQQLGKVIKEITNSRSWRKDRIRQDVVTDDNKVTRIQWVVKDNPEWPIYHLSWCYLTPRQEAFVQWSRRSRLMAASVLKLETLDIRALLLQEEGGWIWDDTMEWSLSLRQIRDINKRNGHTTKIVKPDTLYKLWNSNKLF
jgi:hypothetical protein